MKKSEKTEITVSRILESAMSEFGNKGYAGGTVNNICKTGINKGLLYHNFAGKDALYLTCLKRSSEKMIGYVRECGGAKDLKGYMAVRMDFFRTFPNEAHIVLEAQLNPPAHLSDEINRALTEFHTLNEQVYLKTLDTLDLRDGITREDAVSYFHLMQTMLNGYFSSPVFQNVVFKEKAKMHEVAVLKLFDFILYGVAKGEK